MAKTTIKYYKINGFCQLIIFLIIFCSIIYYLLLAKYDGKE